MKSATPHDELGKVFATAVELHQKGHLREAESLYRAILAVDGKHADALHLLGVAAHQGGDHAVAVDLIGRAIELNDQVAQFHFHRGIAQQAMNEHVAAAQTYRHALRLKPDFAGAWENLGVALQDADHIEAARDAYVQALAIDPCAVLAHQNLGTLLFNLGMVQEAQAHFDAVLSIQPAQAEARSKRASTLLAEARYEEGWPEYEWRHHSTSMQAHYRPRLVPFPKWDGSSLKGKTLLIHPEQGIGEELMFASCYTDAIAGAGRTIIECDPRLLALFERSFPDATVIGGARWQDFAWNESLGHIDYRIPAGTLPRFFRRGLQDFAIDGAYLHVDPVRRAHWQQVLTQFDHKINVGISWHGGKDPRAAKARSVALSEWQPIFDALDANFISIQYGDHNAEISEFNGRTSRRLHTLEDLDLIKDPDDAMALISALDLVISIDNSTVFMAGSIGTPVWVLLPCNGEWRWRGLDAGSPWFPHARLFRQAYPGLQSWGDVLHRVATDLQVHAPNIRRAVEVKNVVVTAKRQPPVATSTSVTPQRALILNDTRSWYHWGCSCTSLAIHSRLRRRWSHVDSLPIQRLLQLALRPTSLDQFDDDPHYERFAAANADVMAQLTQAQAVYVNGEGTLHGVTQQSMGLLYVAYIAKRRLDRTVHIINHSCYPDDTDVAKQTPAFEIYRRVYQHMNSIAVREPISAKLMADLGLSVTESFDCLPLFVRDHAALVQSSPAHRSRSVIIAGSAAWGASSIVHDVGEFIVKLHGSGVQPIVLIGADAHLAADDVQFVATLQRVAGGHFHLLNATSEFEWLRAIASAQLLVSGRFHHTIAAACLGTPFLLMESNTPKISGLLQRLESSSFVSTREQKLSDALFARARETLVRDYRDPVGHEVLERLVHLAELNFSQ